MLDNPTPTVLQQKFCDRKERIKFCNLRNSTEKSRQKPVQLRTLFCSGGRPSIFGPCLARCSSPTLKLIYKMKQMTCLYTKKDLYKPIMFLEMMQNHINLVSQKWQVVMKKFATQQSFKWGRSRGPPLQGDETEKKKVGWLVLGWLNEQHAQDLVSFTRIHRFGKKNLQIRWWFWMEKTCKKYFR